jgi:hypothetical protein
MPPEKLASDLSRRDNQLTAETTSRPLSAKAFENYVNKRS